MTQAVHSSGPLFEFEWRQDRQRRVLRVRGELDGSASEHLINGLIDLGSRRLVIDLTDAGWVSQDVTATLDEIAERLGASRLDVIERAVADGSDRTTTV